MVRSYGEVYVCVQPHRDSKGPARAAYHGHLTQLAAKLQATKHGLLQATLDMNRDWQSFKASYLDQQLVLEDRTSWEVDLPAEHPSPDDMNDPGACQMDVYSQADFDNTEVRTPPMYPSCSAVVPGRVSPLPIFVAAALTPCASLCESVTAFESLFVVSTRFAYRLCIRSIQMVPFAKFA